MWFTECFICLSTLGDLWTCSTYPRLILTPGLTLQLTGEETAPSMTTQDACSQSGLCSIIWNFFSFFQLDEKCDKQYTDYSRVSVPLFCMLLYSVIKLKWKAIYLLSHYLDMRLYFMNMPNFSAFLLVLILVIISTLLMVSYQKLHLLISPSTKQPLIKKFWSDVLKLNSYMSGPLKQISSRIELYTRIMWRPQWHQTDLYFVVLQSYFFCSLELLLPTT